MIFNVGAGGASSADKVKYDNSISGLEATNVQGAIDEVNNSLNCKSFTLLGSVSYVSQTSPTSETKTLNDNISNYKKVLISFFDGTDIMNPVILTVSEFENIGMGMRVFTDKFQGTVTYISDTSCKFTSYGK